MSAVHTIGCLLAACIAMSQALAQTSSVRLHAAGSLRDAFTQIAQRFEHDTGVRVVLALALPDF